MSSMKKTASHINMSSKKKTAIHTHVFIIVKENSASHTYVLITIKSKFNKPHMSLLQYNENSANHK